MGRRLCYTRGISKKPYKEGWNIQTYCIISDNELDNNVVRQCLQSFPCIGEAMLRGHLLSSNVYICSTKAYSGGDAKDF